MNRMVHRLARFVAALIMGTALTTLVPSSAHADGSSGPIAGNDVIQAYVGSFKTIDLALLANDSHPEGKHIWICGIKSVEDDVYFGSVDAYVYNDAGQLSSTVMLSTYFDATVENVQLTYALCDGEHTSWGLVDLDIVYPEQPTVKKTKRPGRVKFINPNDDFLTCGYGSFNEYEPDGWVEVAANSAQVVRVYRHRIDWLCFIGNDWGYAGEGTVRNIVLQKASSQKVAKQATNAALNHRWHSYVS